MLLVPVQVFVLTSDQDDNSAWNLPKQLAFWDRVPTETSVQRVTDGHFGELTSASHSLANWVDGGEQGPAQARLNERYLPDDVWASCGVQFRLVNFTEIRTTVPNTRPTGAALSLDTPLIQNFENLIEPHPNFYCEYSYGSLCESLYSSWTRSTWRPFRTFRQFLTESGRLMRQYFQAERRGTGTRTWSRPTG